MSRPAVEVRIMGSKLTWSRFGCDGDIWATTYYARWAIRPEASDAASYTPGQIVTFRRGSREQRLSRGRAYRVESIDAEAGTVSLATPQGKSVAWSPARWGGDQAEAFVEVEQEFRTGDRINRIVNYSNLPCGDGA